MDNEPSGESTMNRYYELERSSLEEQVSKGVLRELTASNGKMYILPLGNGDFPVAISTHRVVVRSGDTVQFSRDGGSGPNMEARASIADFHINPNNREIEFRFENQHVSPNPALRAQDIVDNLSAVHRAMDNARTSAT